MNNWISVKERLPAHETKVLIYTTNFEIETAVRNNKEQRENGATEWFYPENNGWYSQEVTHWMPLPEPPNE